MRRILVTSTPWLTRNIIVFGIASLLSDMSYELAIAALPEFLISLSNSHTTALLLGFITGLADAASYFSRLFFGWLSDRLRTRKPFVVLGYLLAGGSVSFLSFVTSHMQVLVTIVLSRLGKGVRNPARDALLADSVEPAYYGRVFGFHRSMDTLGALIGPFALFIVAPLFSLRTIFLLAGIPALVAAAVVYVYVQEIKPAKHVLLHETKLSLWQAIALFPRSFLAFCAIVFVFNCAFFHPAMLILYLQQTQNFTGSEAVRIGALAYVFFNCVRSISEYRVGFLSDRKGSLAVLSWCGYGLFGLLALLLLLIKPHLWFFVPVFLIGGITKGIIDTLERVVAAQLVESRYRATAFGVLFCGKGIGMALAGMIVGILWSRMLHWIAFSYVAGISFLATLALLILSRYTVLNFQMEAISKSD